MREAGPDRGAAPGQLPSFEAWVHISPDRTFALPIRFGLRSTEKH
jgi:hypothetical protein